MTNSFTNIVSVHLYGISAKGKRKCLAAGQSPNVGIGFEESMLAKHKTWLMSQVAEFRDAGFTDFEIEYSKVYNETEEVA